MPLCRLKIYNPKIAIHGRRYRIGIKYFYTTIKMLYRPNGYYMGDKTKYT